MAAMDFDVKEEDYIFSDYDYWLLSTKDSILIDNENNTVKQFTKYKFKEGDHVGIMIDRS